MENDLYYLLRESAKLVWLMFMEHRRERKQIMSALDDLMAANTAEQSELTTLIKDWRDALAGATSAADVESVVSQMNARVTAMQDADPTSTGSAPSAPSA